MERTGRWLEKGSWNWKSWVHCVSVPAYKNGEFRLKYASKIVMRLTKTFSDSIYLYQTFGVDFGELEHTNVVRKM